MYWDSERQRASPHWDLQEAGKDKTREEDQLLLLEEEGEKYPTKYSLALK